jgi:kynureninase
VNYRDDVWRFLNGTPHIPCLYACRPGLEILNELDRPAARRKSLRQTGMLIERARGHGWKVTVSDDAERRAGTVAFDVPHAFEVAKELLASDVLIDYRPRAGIRVSPHFYNSDEECGELIDRIERILREGAWERHVEASRTVT